MSGVKFDSLEVLSTLGIGTTATDGMLTIKKTGSNIFGDSAITIQSADTNQSTLALGLTGSVAYIDSTESGSGTVLPLVFATGSTEKMRIDTEGALNFSNSSVSFNSNNKTFAHTNNFQYFIGGSNGLYLADNYDLSNAIGIRDANYIDFSADGSERMRIESTGPIIPDGSLGLEQYRPVFTGANAASYTTTTNLAYTKTSTQYVATGEHFKARVRARAYTKYVHMKTNLASNNIMFFFRINGYFYNYGVNESVRGGYTYNDGVIAEHVQNTYNSNSNFTISDFYRSSTGNFLCLKLELQHSNYTEGEALVYFSSHTPSIARDLQITDMQHRNDETNAY